MLKNAGIVAAAFTLLVLCATVQAPAQIRPWSEFEHHPAVLYAVECSSCHGSIGQGSNEAPSLIGVPKVYVHFMLDTGRMPASVPYVQHPHKPSLFTEREIDELSDYIVDHFSMTNDRALPIVGPGDVARGRELFSVNCQQCHGVGAAGEAIGYGYQRVAPSLHHATIFEVAEAIRSGPGVMPRFGENVLSDQDVDDIAHYVNLIQVSDQNPGGLALSNVGASAEGLVAWTVGIGLLVFLIKRLSLAE
jgi:ubiquinol-cytochrome c reductase cytochrome c subunit